MFVSIRLYMHHHRRSCVLLEINHAEGRGVPPPYHTEAANNAARNWQKFNGCTEKLYEGSLPVTWQISPQTVMFIVLFKQWSSSIRACGITTCILVLITAGINPSVCQSEKGQELCEFVMNSEKRISNIISTSLVIKSFVKFCWCRDLHMLKLTFLAFRSFKFCNS
jgi:hypothetical protein